MILRAVPLDFSRDRGFAMPVDAELHRFAIDFAQKELAAIPNFSEFAKVWVAVESDADGKPTAVRGALGFTMRPDFTLCRFLDRTTFVTLYNRADAYMADNGARGSEVLVYVNQNEAPEQKCPQQLESLKAVKAVPADRWVLKIR